MKKFLSIIAVSAMSFMAAACGQVVEVPPAHVGKILTPNGYLPDTIPPSTFRLTSCAFVVCDKLVLIEVSDQSVVEGMDVFMPNNQLMMDFDLRVTGSIKDTFINPILAKMKSEKVNSRIRYISFEKVYTTYTQQIIRSSVRSVVAEYTIDEIASSRDLVNTKIAERLNLVLATTPIELKVVGLGKVNYPEVITKRKEQAEERRIEIEQEEARKQVELIKIQTRFEMAKAERAIRREKAMAAAEENKIAAKSITPQYLQYKRLEVLEKLAESNASVFVPFGALDDVGLSQKVFRK